MAGTNTPVPRKIEEDKEVAVTVNLQENFSRMSSDDFEYLLNEIGPKVGKRDTNMRKAIPVKEHLAVTLRFFATGDSFTSLGYLIKISHQFISCILPDICQAFIELPQSEDEWKQIANGFFQRWNFPHCVGAIGGKHILLQSPFNSESTSSSIILLTLVDADYCFTFIDVGAQGRMNDAGVFACITLYHKMLMRELSFPPDESLPGRQLSVPCFYSSSILKPYAGNHAKGTIERIFNYRLCQAQRIVENVFGILAYVFCVLKSPMLLQPKKAARVCMICALLHNYLWRSTSSRHIYTPNGVFDYEADGHFKQLTWRQDTSNSSLAPLTSPIKSLSIYLSILRYPENHPRRQKIFYNQQSS
ncbi:hypothetical protein J437_LFUL011185 [Ladona fulva]|uniref:DDE Tnp4 domain-containing protein n=1 Tax=Ladona fulva TaxID=123851 RepID=A0A8K0KL95_LADFU|nr:hypothetical protein J437_LFUL011185 [Ladona fulva]